MESSIWSAWLTQNRDRENGIWSENAPAKLSPTMFPGFPTWQSNANSMEEKKVRVSRLLVLPIRISSAATTHGSHVTSSSLMPVLIVHHMARPTFRSRRHCDEMHRGVKLTHPSVVPRREAF